MSNDTGKQYISRSKSFDPIDSAIRANVTQGAHLRRRKEWIERIKKAKAYLLNRFDRLANTPIDISAEEWAEHFHDASISINSYTEVSKDFPNDHAGVAGLNWLEELREAAQFDPTNRNADYRPRLLGSWFDESLQVLCSLLVESLTNRSGLVTKLKELLRPENQDVFKRALGCLSYVREYIANGFAPVNAADPRQLTKVETKSHDKSKSGGDANGNPKEPRQRRRRNKSQSQVTTIAEQLFKADKDNARTWSAEKWAKQIGCAKGTFLESKFYQNTFLPDRLASQLQILERGGTIDMRKKQRRKMELKGTGQK
jgi:hypothetical protein